MKKLHAKILSLVLLSGVLCAPNVYAVSKLDYTEPVNDLTVKVQKVKERIEQKYTEVLEILNGKVRKAFSGEGASLINEFVYGKSSGLVGNTVTGQLAVGDSDLSGLSQSMLSQLGSFKLDLANLVTLADDYEKALQYGKLEKTKQINVLMSQYEAERDAVRKALESEPDNEELKAKFDDLNVNIANMQAQVRSIMTEQSEDDQKLQSYKNSIASLDTQIGNLSTMKASNELVKALNSKLDNLFDKLSDTESPYTTSMNKLFLGAYESPTSENLMRIKKARKKEYYDALKNAAREYLSAYKSIEKITEESQSCVEALSKADGIAGQQTMQICVDLQQAKAAAGYTQFLLARLRCIATGDLQMGSGNDTVNGYADQTKFNLDNYKFKKSDLYLSNENGTKNAIANFTGF
ncbi:MAG: hypothetical protein MJ212_00505 [Alphaproteobacteria bacterium]|nr:hypothetical protein [Alphaproteobacteria bacterium]